MLVPLSEATRDECGGKAATLGVLLRAGLPVPDGFVVPHDVASRTASASAGSLRSAVAHELARLGDPVVAVRSSAANEDGGQASAAGQYESVIGVRGVDDVCAAIETCWASAETARVEVYWNRHDPAGALTPGMGVLVQRMIDADVAGVMFTPPHRGGSTRIEAAWGLGVGVVGGTVTPDSYEVAPDGTVAHIVESKDARVDLDTERGGIITTHVSAAQQNVRALDDALATALTELGNRIAAIQGSPQDIEWAITGGTAWILQARPITAALPQALEHRRRVAPAQALHGAAGAPGTVTAAARIVRGPSGFQAVQPGEIIVCPYTDPAWTPLFSVAAGVVTETGGVLSHAAIVAREYGIPAVLGVPDALRRIRSGQLIELDGASGTVIPA